MVGIYMLGIVAQDIALDVVTRGIITTKRYSLLSIDLANICVQYNIVNNGRV